MFTDQARYVRPNLFRLLELFDKQQFREVIAYWTIKILTGYLVYIVAYLSTLLDI